MKWYVYHLIDPKDKSVFYVGKGSKKRAWQHTKDAIKGIRSHKCNKIRDILTYGEVGIHIVQRFDDEQEAFKFESSEIIRLNGGKLTNVMVATTLSKMKPIEPFTPERAFIWINKAVGQMAWWAYHTNFGKQKIKVIARNHPAPKFLETVNQLFIDKFAPTALNTAVSDCGYREKCQNLFYEFGLDMEKSLNASP